MPVSVPSLSVKYHRHFVTFVAGCWMGCCSLHLLKWAIERGWMIQGNNPRCPKEMEVPLHSPPAVFAERWWETSDAP